MSSDSSNYSNVSDTDYPVHKIIQRRWSPRSFVKDPIDSELLRQIFDAARWAPSSYNEQPWRFIVATRDEPEEYGKLLDILNPGNRRWAQHAPVLILTVVKEMLSRSDSRNRAAEHDLGQAVAHLSFEATRNDIYIHQIAGIDLQKAREVFNIPKGYAPFTGIALGYIDEPDQPPTRSRKELDEIFFRGDWKKV